MSERESPPSSPSKQHRPGHVVSTVAKYERQMRALNASLHTLRRQNEDQERKLDDARANLKAERDLREAADRSLRSARRQLERASDDRKALQRDLQEQRDGRRNAEQKIAMGSKGQYLATKNKELLGRLKEVSAQRSSQQAVVERQEAELQKAAAEIDILMRAVDLRAEELGLGTAHGGMLYQVAQQRHESHRLALDLAAASDSADQLRDDLHEAQFRCRSAEQAAEEARQHVEGADKARADALARAEAAVQECRAATGERDGLSRSVRELSQQLAESEAARKDAAAESERSHQELQYSVTMLSDEAEAAKAKAEAALNDVERLRKRQQVTETFLISERKKTAELAEALRAAESNVVRLEGDAASLHQQLDELTETNVSLQATLRGDSHQREQLDAQASRAEAQLAELRASRERQHDVELQLKTELERVLSDLKQLGHDRDEAVHKCAEAELAFHAQEDHLQSLTTQLTRERALKRQTKDMLVQHMASMRCGTCKGPMSQSSGSARLSAELVLAQAASSQFPPAPVPSSSSSSSSSPSRSAPPAPPLPASPSSSADAIAADVTLEDLAL